MCCIETFLWVQETKVKIYLKLANAQNMTHATLILHEQSDTGGYCSHFKILANNNKIEYISEQNMKLSSSTAVVSLTTLQKKLTNFN